MPKSLALPQNLKAIRWVQKNPDKETSDSLCKRFQELFRDDFPKFCAMAKSEEKDYRDAKEVFEAKKAGKGPESLKDEGTERIRELCDQILDEALNDNP